VAHLDLVAADGVPFRWDQSPPLIPTCPRPPVKQRLCHDRHGFRGKESLAIDPGGECGAWGRGVRLQGWERARDGHADAASDRPRPRPHGRAVLRSAVSKLVKSMATGRSGSTFSQWGRSTCDALQLQASHILFTRIREVMKSSMDEMLNHTAAPLPYRQVLLCACPRTHCRVCRVYREDPWLCLPKRWRPCASSIRIPFFFC
jgi:hypothetical protein